MIVVPFKLMDIIISLNVKNLSVTLSRKRDSNPRLTHYE